MNHNSWYGIKTEKPNRTDNINLIRKIQNPLKLFQPDQTNIIHKIRYETTISHPHNLIFTHTQTHTHTNRQTHTHTHTHTYTHIYIIIFINLYLYIYIYIYIVLVSYVYTGWNDKIVALEKTTRFYFRLMKTGFLFCCSPSTSWPVVYKSQER